MRMFLRKGAVGENPEFKGTELNSSTGDPFNKYPSTPSSWSQFLRLFLDRHSQLTFCEIQMPVAWVIHSRE